MTPGSGKRRNAEPPWAAFADALSGVLFVFILTTCWFAWQLAEATKKQDAERERLEGYREDARKLVGSEAAPGALTRCLQQDVNLIAVPQRTDARILLYLRGVEWFGLGSAELRPDQLPAAKAIRACLDDVLVRQAASLALDRDNIVVFFEGHTDALVPRQGFVSNWELSAARAAAVLRVVLGGADPATGGSPGLLQRVGQGRIQLLPVGLGDTRPAWERLCGSDEPAAISDDVDATLCNRLPWRDSAGQTTSRRMAEVAAVLDAHPEAWTQVKRDCAAPDAKRFTASTPNEKLVFWANRCPEGATGTEAARNNDPRRSLFRRVDLRIEIDPLDQAGTQ